MIKIYLINMKLRLRKFVDLILNLTILGMELVNLGTKIKFAFMYYYKIVFIKPIIRTFSTR